MSCPQRVVLFVDNQNFYNWARRAFFPDSDWHVHGQFNPVLLGQLITSRPVGGTTRVLHQVRVYTGRPKRFQQPQSYAANRRQCAAWENWGAKVIWRPLKYPRDWPNTKAQQKGIDVALAVDLVALAVDGEYDVGVIVSADTDLRPALEFVLARYEGKRWVEAVAWKTPRSYVSLSVPRREISCHWLTKADYDEVADLTDYTVP